MGLAVDVNLIYTRLRENRGDTGDSVLQIANSLFFQRSKRHWRGHPVPPGPG